MNAIEAWQKAEVGDVIKMECTDRAWTKLNNHAYDDLHNFIRYCVSCESVTGDWEATKKPIITPQSGDVWAYTSVITTYCFSLGCRSMIREDGTLVPAPTFKNIAHNQNGWHLLFRDGKPYTEGN